MSNIQKPQMENCDTFHMSEKQKEQVKRKRKFNKKMFVSVLLYLVGTICLLSYEKLPPILTSKGYSSIDIETLDSIIGLIGGLSGIAGVMLFAKALHDPLTEEEARELAERDRVEK